MPKLRSFILSAALLAGFNFMTHPETYAMFLADPGFDGHISWKNFMQLVWIESIMKDFS
ncbi:MAG: hypothetical protein ABIO50_04005 [Nitrosospira sp.]